MEIKYSSEIPVSVERHGTRRTLNYNVRELGESELKELWDKELNKENMSYEVFVREHKYSYNSLSIGNGRWGYSGIVEAIIREKYTNDQMEAITNNVNVIVAEFFNTLVTDGLADSIKYLLSSVKSENMENFRDMQEWRALAKREARNVLKMY